MTDLKITYSTLDDILNALGIYRGALSEMESAIDTTTAIVLQSKGEGIHAIQTLSDNTRKGLDKYKDQLGDLINVISGFISDMTGYIMPEARGTQMRVSRDNIKWSVGKIEDNVNKDIDSINRALYKAPGRVYVTEDEAAALQRNESRLHSLSGAVSSFASGMHEIITDLWDLYNYKVSPYQDCDEEYARLVSKLYDSYSNWWEKFCDFWGDVGSTIGNFFAGLGISLWELVKGLGLLVWGLLKLAAADVVFYGAWLFTGDIEKTPKWTQDVIMSFGQSVDLILQDPSRIVEGLSHSISEAWDNKGAAYCIGYGVGQILPIVATWGIGALGDAGDVAEVADLIAQGASAEELLAMGVDASTLFKAGITASELMDLVSTGELTMEELLSAVPVGELLSEVTVDELSSAGIEISDLVAAGASVEELANAGATVEELLSTVPEVNELVNAGAKMEDIVKVVETMTESDPDKIASALNGFGELNTSLKPFTALTSYEKEVVIKLLTQGKDVELMPELPNISKTFDFLVDGIPTELKTLTEGNINTLVTKVGRALEQLGDSGGNIIYDISKAGFSSEQMEEILARLIGKYGEDIVDRVTFIQ